MYQWNSKSKFYMEDKGNGLVNLINFDTVFTNIESDRVVTDYYTEYSLNVPVYKDTLYKIFEPSPKAQRYIRNIMYKENDLFEITKTYHDEICNFECVEY